MSENTTPNLSADVLWDIWKYRHNAFYEAIYRYGTAIVLVTIAPYIREGLILELGYAVLILPFFGLAVVVFACLHLLSEAGSLMSIHKKWREVAKWDCVSQPRGDGSASSVAETTGGDEGMPSPAYRALFFANIFTAITVVTQTVNSIILLLVIEGLLGSP